MYSQEYINQIHNFPLSILKREIEKAQESHHSVGVLLIDVDHFNSFNFEFGHLMGDLILGCLERLYRGQINSMDCWASNFRSDEFLIIMPNASLDDTRRTAKRICTVTKHVTISYEGEECGLVNKGKSMGSVTVSIGGVFYPIHGESPESIMFAADEALSHAKKQGRNQVVMRSEINPI